MRWAYTFLLYLAVPFALLRLLWKSRLQPEYRARVGERFGYVQAPAQAIAVWVHAVSVGEALAAAPMIERLIHRHGERRVWVTTTTPTGSARVTAAFGQRVYHSYVPYDLPSAVARFVDRIHPGRVVVMETELWPTLFRGVRKRGIPLLIANARLSPRSYRGYQRLRRSVAGVLADSSLVAAQSEADAERFRCLGAPRVMVMGNIKFDLTPPQAQLEQGRALRAALGTTRPVWIAASTHEGEESVVLEAHAALLRQWPEAALVLVPRHPQRFADVARLLERSGLRWCRRSAGAPRADAQVLLGDSMGEMFAYFAAADLTFVGGSFAPVGGHNILEPAAIGLPVLFGPHMHNFVAASELLLQAGAAEQVSDPAVLAFRLAALLREPETRRRMGEAGAQAVAVNRGALDKLLAALDQLSPAR